MKANTSFCYCNAVSAKHTLDVVRTTPQSTIVVGSPHIVIMSGPALMKGQDKSVHILIATTSHEDIQTLTVQWHKSA